MITITTGRVSILLAFILLSPAGVLPEDSLQHKAYQKIQRLQVLYDTYHRLYGRNPDYREKWQVIDREILFLKRLYKNGDYSSALRLREEIKQQIIQIRRPVNQRSPYQEASGIPYELITVLNRFPEDLSRQEQAFALLERLLEDGKLPAEDRNLLTYIRNQKKETAGQLVREALQTGNSFYGRRELERLVRLFDRDPVWTRKQLDRIREQDRPARLSQDPYSDPDGQVEESPPGTGNLRTGPEENSPDPALPDITSEDESQLSASRPYFLTMDVWQSAWGDFSGIDRLLVYLAENGISRVNLNPGLPMGPKYYAEAYRSFKPLVDRFYTSGIEKVNFLYAERNYPIKYYARFLREHPDLRIDTIVDDSEFIDIFQDRFEQNLLAVKENGLYYSAFVTLEIKGNSGVSDRTRFWVLEHVDYPILMSYFSCRLKEQKQLLDKYLDYADRLGRRRCVSVALLLGSKKVGREISCELVLEAGPMQILLKEIDRWARHHHPSYQGIVIETNLPLPRYPVNPAGK